MHGSFGDVWTWCTTEQVLLKQCRASLAANRASVSCKHWLHDVEHALWSISTSWCLQPDCTVHANLFERQHVLLMDALCKLVRFIFQEPHWVKH
jgi:hypothetical protein